MKNQFPDEDPTELIEIPKHMLKKPKVGIMDFTAIIHKDGYA
jgi:hypothetical protein